MLRDHKMLMEYMKYFPYPTIRDAQKEAIDFALNALITNDKTVCYH